MGTPFWDLAPPPRDRRETTPMWGTHTWNYPLRSRWEGDLIKEKQKIVERQKGRWRGADPTPTGGRPGVRRERWAKEGLFPQKEEAWDPATEHPAAKGCRGAGEQVWGGGSYSFLLTPSPGFHVRLLTRGFRAGREMAREEPKERLRLRWEALLGDVETQQPGVLHLVLGPQTKRAIFPKRS